MCAGALGAGACDSGSGTVHLQLDMPSEATLSPLDARLANLTMVVEGEGVAPSIQTVAVGAPGVPIALGEVPLASGLRVSLIASSAGGRLIGFGRGVETLDASTGDDTSVVVRMRRPFAYVAGQTRLTAFDTTLEPQTAYTTELQAVVSAPRAVAVTPDGADLVTVDGGQLVLVATADHATVRGRAPVGINATDIAFSPDGRMAVVAHPAGLSIVDVEAMRAGETTPAEVAIAGVDRVAVSNTAAYALVNAWDDNGCASPSSVVRVPLDAPQPEAPLLATSVVADVAMEPRSGTLLVALPCENKIGVVDGSGAVSQSFDVPGATMVAVASGRIFAVGRGQSATGAFLVLSSVGVDGSAAAQVNLPVTQERALSEDFDMSGQAAEMRINADGVRAVDLAVLPDGSRVVLLVRASYHSDKSGGEFFPFDSIIPAIDIVTHEYLLLDAGTGAALQRMRTRCDIDWTHTSYLDAFRCTQAAGQDLAMPEFEPTRVSVLFGER